MHAVPYSFSAAFIASEENNVLKTVLVQFGSHVVCKERIEDIRFWNGVVGGK
jgi:hypothetical protein